MPRDELDCQERSPAMRWDELGVPTRHLVVVRGAPWRVVRGEPVVAKWLGAGWRLVPGRLLLRLVAFC